MYTAAEWRALGAVLRAHPRVVVLSDEIYEHIQWTGERFASFAAECPDLYDRTITVNGMSKGYAMSGWRIGYAAGPIPVIKAMTSLQGQSTTNACTISQAAAREALAGDQACVRDMCAEFKRRHDAFFAGVRGLPGFECVPAAGTFYLFPNVEAAMRAKGAATRRRALRAPARRGRRRARARHGVRRAGSLALVVCRVHEHARRCARTSRRVLARLIA